MNPQITRAIMQAAAAVSHVFIFRGRRGDLLRNAHATNQFRYRHACFGRFQHRHNLLDTEALVFHRTAPFILKKSAENSLTSWHCLLGPLTVDYEGSLISV
nr:hypothetical protein [Burkholderia cepacia]